jgi:hypothetical protein
VEDGMTGQHARSAIERLTAALAAGLRFTEAARDGAEAYNLARELAPLLQDSRRATLTVRCPKGRPAYRVFEISGRLLGVPATDVWVGSGDGTWTLTPDWLPRRATEPHWYEGRCHCCDRAHRLELATLQAALKANKRSIKIRAVGS